MRFFFELARKILFRRSAFSTGDIRLKKSVSDQPCTKREAVSLNLTGTGGENTVSFTTEFPNILQQGRGSRAGSTLPHKPKPEKYPPGEVPSRR